MYLTKVYRKKHLLINKIKSTTQKNGKELEKALHERLPNDQKIEKLLKLISHQEHEHIILSTFASMAKINMQRMSSVGGDVGQKELAYKTTLENSLASSIDQAEYTTIPRNRKIINIKENISFTFYSLGKSQNFLVQK